MKNLLGHTLPFTVGETQDLMNIPYKINVCNTEYGVVRFGEALVRFEQEMASNFPKVTQLVDSTT